MKSLTFSSLALLAAGTAFAQSSTCPFNYPITLNATQSLNGLVFTIASNNAVTNNRAIQLRPNPNLKGGFFAGLDATSPVLLSNLARGGLKSQARSLYNQIYDLGPTAYLNLRDDINGTQRYTVGVVNATTWPGKVDRHWILIGGEADGTYGLYHDEPVGVVNGFLLCVADHDLRPGPWYQLFYYTYESSSADIPGCESVGLRTTVSATIQDGKCAIGGYMAS
ncbi:hypothetical protein F5B17DRAFT_303857 [Nemania serpens]|nr:hypothetical protein F5B17DRAFT_303857 [Nemania serpens]